MECCTNPIDLFCFTSCDTIKLPLAGSVGQTHLVRYNFNGFVSTFFTTVINGFHHITPGYFNESSNVIFSVIRTSDNVQLGCYKAKILPTDTNL